MSHAHGGNIPEEVPNEHEPVTIDRYRLARLTAANSPLVPTLVDDHGTRRRWVGCGWLTEGRADGSETRITD